MFISSTESACVRNPSRRDFRACSLTSSLRITQFSWNPEMEGAGDRGPRPPRGPRARSFWNQKRHERDGSKAKGRKKCGQSFQEPPRGLPGLNKTNTAAVQTVAQPHGARTPSPWTVRQLLLQVARGSLMRPGPRRTPPSLGPPLRSAVGFSWEPPVTTGPAWPVCSPRRWGHKTVPRAPRITHEAERAPVVSAGKMKGSRTAPIYRSTDCSHLRYGTNTSVRAGPDV
ncbi:uncharacterized protein LOC132523811 [Lagenorhynchus albirostris]|uniref:uncharacterized protein LOC132523811 n=1 Tax=Lagenorhynchus albirostris TaxID=27610 RepID=UPI0028E8511B|nr:uncharacterized protein LOC132523811 [Lagenorhynchus albirostris]